MIKKNFLKISLISFEFSIIFHFLRSFKSKVIFNEINTWFNSCFWDFWECSKKTWFSDPMKTSFTLCFCGFWWISQNTWINLIGTKTWGYLMIKKCPKSLNSRKWPLEEELNMVMIIPFNYTPDLCVVAVTLTITFRKVAIRLFYSFTFVKGTDMLPKRSTPVDQTL